MLHTQTRCRSVHERGVTARQKAVENQDWAVGCWAAGLLLAKPINLSSLNCAKLKNDTHMPVFAD